MKLVQECCPKHLHMGTGSQQQELNETDIEDKQRIENTETSKLDKKNTFQMPSYSSGLFYPKIANSRSSGWIVQPANSYTTPWYDRSINTQ